MTLGYAGQTSLAQAAFMGLGAYTTAILTTKYGVNWYAAFALSGLLTFAVGLLLGFPALRVRTHYLAFVTLAFSTLIWLVLRNEQWLTGGVFGISNINRPYFFGIKLFGALEFHRFVVVVTLILSLKLCWLVRSPWGRAFTALRENPVRAASLGIDTRAYTPVSYTHLDVYKRQAGHPDGYGDRAERRSRPRKLPGRGRQRQAGDQHHPAPDQAVSNPYILNVIPGEQRSTRDPSKGAAFYDGSRNSASLRPG